MAPHRRADASGYTVLEVLVALSVGVVVLLGLSLLYQATINAFSESSSQAALQRQGALALQVLARQSQAASRIGLTCANPPAPAGTTGRSLEVYVPVIPHPDPADLNGDKNGTYYCYYAGNGVNGAPAGALCQRRTAMDAGGLAAPGPCWNLLAPSQPGMFRRTGQEGVILLIQQTNPANPFCPTNSDGTAIASGASCVAFGQNASTADVAFAISDGVGSMSLTASLMKRNP
jgi:hypothetical protein